MDIPIVIPGKESAGLLLFDPILLHVREIDLNSHASAFLAKFCDGYSADLVTKSVFCSYSHLSNSTPSLGKDFPVYPEKENHSKNKKHGQCHCRHTA
jgi:hypothetical protein